jgi:hypothetical protein
VLAALVALPRSRAPIDEVPNDHTPDNVQERCGSSPASSVYATPHPMGYFQAGSTDEMLVDARSDWFKRTTGSNSPQTWTANGARHSTT